MINRKLLTKTNVNFVSIVFGNFFYYGIQYILLILFTKCFLQSEVGIYIYALAFIKPIFIPLNLQLRSLFVTETNDEFGVKDYHSLRIMSNVITLLSVFVIAWFSSVNHMPLLLLIATIKIIESQSEMCHAVFQKAEDMTFIGVSKFINGSLILVAVTVGIYLECSFTTIMFIWLAVSTAVLLFLDMPKAKQKDASFLKLKSYFNFKAVKQILRIAWPLFFLELIMKYYESYPNLYVEKHFGLELLAVFGSILYFKAIGGQILTQVINIVEPKLANLFKLKDFKSFHKLVLKLVFLGAIIGVLILIVLNYIGAFVLEILFTSAYAEYSYLLVLIAISSAISYLYSFLSTALTCMRKHQIKVPIGLLGLLCLLALVYFNAETTNVYTFVTYLIYTELFIGTMFYVAYFYFLSQLKPTE